MVEKDDAARVVVETGKTLKIGDEAWTIRGGDEAPAVFVDFFSEFRQYNGVVSLAFAQAIVDVGNRPEVAIVSRLRMSLGTAQALHHILGDLIADATKPPDKSKTN